MKYLEIGEAKIPALGLGTWQMEKEACREVVSAALECGYRHIDTAQAYENEDEIGDGIQDSRIPRSEIFITDKVWMSNVSAREMDASVAKSLRKLKCNYIDLLLLHWPVEEIPLEEQVDALMEVKESGKARYVGVSNYPVPMMQRAHELSKGQIINNQVEYHPFLPQKPVLEFVREHDMILTAYSPLARGEIFKSEVMKEIAAKYNKNPAQISLRWLIEQQGVAAIPKASGIEHLQTNIDIFDFELDEDDRRMIDQLQSQRRRLINPSWAPRWDDAEKELV
jgi:2,5-diketo-D-gluconate reductase B